MCFYSRSVPNAVGRAVQSKVVASVEAASPLLYSVPSEISTLSDLALLVRDWVRSPKRMASFHPGEMHALLLLDVVDGSPSSGGERIIGPVVHHPLIVDSIIVSVLGLRVLSAVDIIASSDTTGTATAASAATDIDANS